MSGLLRRKISMLGLLAILMRRSHTASHGCSSAGQFDAVLGSFSSALNGSDTAGPDSSPLPEKAVQWQACACCGLLAHMPGLPGGTSAQGRLRIRQLLRHRTRRQLSTKGKSSSQMTFFESGVKKNRRKCHRRSRLS
jgi:hypothetical protein